MPRSALLLVLAACTASPPGAVAPARLEIPPLPDLPCPFAADPPERIAGVPVRSAEGDGWVLVAAADHLLVRAPDGTRHTWWPPGIVRDLAFGGGFAWIAADRAGLVRVDPATGEIRTWPLPLPARAVATDGATVWTADDGGTVWRLQDGRMDRFDLDLDIERIVAAPGGAWATDRLHALVRPVGAPTGPPPDPEAHAPPPDPTHLAAVSASPPTGSSPFRWGPVVSAEPWGGGLIVGVAGEADGAVVPVGVDAETVVLDGPIVDLAVRGDAVAAITPDRVFAVDPDEGRATPLPSAAAATLTAIAWAPDGSLTLVDEGQGLLPPLPATGAYRRHLDAVHFAGATVVSLGFEGRLLWYREGAVDRTALPAPAGRIVGPVDEGRLRVHGDTLWVPMPDWGLARVDRTGAFRATRLPTGAWDTAPTAGGLAVALGPGGLGLVDPAGPSLVGRCDLPGETTRLASTPAGLWALSSGVATRLLPAPGGSAGHPGPF